MAKRDRLASTLRRRASTAVVTEELTNLSYNEVAVRTTRHRVPRWCTVKPVATHGFTLTGLRAKTHLVNISVRCQNEIGWSDPSETVPEVYTEGDKHNGGAGWRRQASSWR